MIGVGEEFPHTTLNGVVGINPDKVIKQVYTDDEQGDWKVIFFYPKDFTFICPTEIAGFDTLVDHANVIGISGDNEFCKLAWKQENELIGNIRHTLAADCGLGLSHTLGIVNNEEGVCYRATFIFDRDRTIQHASVNALDTGRNHNEVLRTLKGLQAGGLTGCEWNEGDDFVA